MFYILLLLSWSKSPILPLTITNFLRLDTRILSVAAVHLVIVLTVKLRTTWSVWYTLFRTVPIALICMSFPVSKLLLACSNVNNSIPHLVSWGCHSTKIHWDGGQRLYPVWAELRHSIARIFNQVLSTKLFENLVEATDTLPAKDMCNIGKELEEIHGGTLSSISEFLCPQSLGKDPVP